MFAPSDYEDPRWHEADPAAIYGVAELLGHRSPAWHADAACRERPDLNWFPERGEDVRQAKAVCSSCPVRSDCLADALANRRHHGIWGAPSERERRPLRRAATQERSAA